MYGWERASAAARAQVRVAFAVDCDARALACVCNSIGGTMRQHVYHRHRRHRSDVERGGEGNDVDGECADPKAEGSVCRP